MFWSLQEIRHRSKPKPLRLSVVCHTLRATGTAWCLSSAPQKTISQAVPCVTNTCLLSLTCTATCSTGWWMALVFLICEALMQRCTWSCPCGPSIVGRRWFPTTILAQRNLSTCRLANTLAWCLGPVSNLMKNSTWVSTCGSSWSDWGTNWRSMGSWMVVSLSPTSVSLCSRSGTSREHLSMKLSRCRKQLTAVPMGDPKARTWLKLGRVSNAVSHTHTCVYTRAHTQKNLSIYTCNISYMYIFLISRRC